MHSCCDKVPLLSASNTAKALRSCATCSSLSISSSLATWKYWLSTMRKSSGCSRVVLLDEDPPADRPFMRIFSHSCNVNSYTRKRNLSESTLNSLFHFNASTSASTSSGSVCMVSSLPVVGLALPILDHFVPSLRSFVKFIICANSLKFTTPSLSRSTVFRMVAFSSSVNRKPSARNTSSTSDD
eukprot:7391821-Prymnesium_polylepis.3